MENSKTVFRKGCASREIQQPLLQDATSVEREKQFLGKAVI